MSSENRFMAWKIFDSEVPPLKRSRPDSASIEKSCFRTQQTQKSFSTIASDRPLRSAVSANNSARTLPAKFLRPTQGLQEVRPVRGWIPLHDDQLRGNSVTSGLFDPAVNKDLHPAYEIAAVVIVARGDDQREIGLRAYSGLAVRHRCHPNAR